MRFLQAIIAYVVTGLVLAWGIPLAVKGKPRLVIVGFPAYAVAFTKLGCLPKKSR